MIKLKVDTEQEISVATIGSIQEGQAFVEFVGGEVRLKTDECNDFGNIQVVHLESGVITSWSASRVVIPVTVNGTVTVD
jgi:hypothetical protein